MSRKLRVVLFGKLPPPYIGPAVATQRILASDLVNRYQIVHMDTSDHRGIHTLAKIDLGNILIALKQYLVFLGLCFKHRPDLCYILNAQTTVAYLRDIPFVLVARLFRQKIIFHLRGGHFGAWYATRGRMMKWLIGCVHARVHTQIVLGENLRWMFQHVVPDHRISVLPNGGDYPRAKPNVSRAAPVEVLYLGNFIPSKGIHEYLDAARELVHQYPDIRFTAAGSWQDGETRKRMLDENTGYEDRVKIIDTVGEEQKWELLNRAHIFVFPSYYIYEGHPWVIVEAMAAALPVITTNHAAIPESVIDGYNGILVEKRSSTAVRDAVVRLLDDDDTRIAMGRKSRMLYEQRFTEKCFIDGLDGIFQAVLNR